MAKDSTPRFTFDDPPGPRISPTDDTLGYLLTLRDAVTLLASRMNPDDPTVQQAQRLLESLES